MGRRDYRWRDAKKPKKKEKKSPTTAVVQPQVGVEVIKKRKKEKREE